MPNYTYIAINTKRESINGTITQDDRAAVITALTKQGLRPVSIKEVGSSATNFAFLTSIFNGKKIKSDQLVLVTRQLSAMVSAGVPLIKALNSLKAHSGNNALKAVLEAVIKDIEGGAQLADALAKHPDAFNDVYVNMVRAGEAAGILDEILKRLAYQQEKSSSMRKKIKSAMIYPYVLLGITVLAFFGLMIFIVPQIKEILLNLGGPEAKLPEITLFMLSISDAIIGSWFFILPLLGFAIYGISRFIKTPRGKSLFDQLILKIPIIRTVIQKIAIARFSRTFSALMGAGVAVLEALHVTSRAVGNTVYEEALNLAAKEVKSGKPLSHVISQNPLFPPIVAQMLNVGEETGQTDTVLVKVAEFYEEEVDVAIGGVSSIIEPVMIVIMGALVGLVAASVMMPIAGLAQSIK